MQATARYVHLAHDSVRIADSIPAGLLGKVSACLARYLLGAATPAVEDCARLDTEPTQ